MSRIALFVPNLHGGGAEKMMVHLANEFASLGHDCDLVLARAEGPYLDRISDPVRLVELRTDFSNPLVIPRLAKYLRNNTPTAMLSAMTYPNIALLLARRLARVDTRIVISERITMTVQSGKTRSLREKLKPLAARRVYSQADHVVSISDGVADNLAAATDIPRSEITTIYNPVVTARELEPLKSPDHPWYRECPAPLIMAAGRLVLQKDFSCLLSAFAEVLQQQDARLLILGEGPERDRLTQQARALGIDDFVDMPGYTGQLYAFMQHSDLFVMSSAWEGFGNVLVEALACGCPVVSTDCPSGPSEILDHGKIGRLVPTGSPSDLAAAILATLDSPPNRDTLTARAHAFSASESARRYLEVMLDT